MHYLFIWIQRWALDLMSYDCTIIHREGDRMRQVDALSINHEKVVVVEPNSIDQVLAWPLSRDAIQE